MRARQSLASAIQFALWITTTNYVKTPSPSKQLTGARKKSSREYSSSSNNQVAITVSANTCEQGLILYVNRYPQMNCNFVCDLY